MERDLRVLWSPVVDEVAQHEDALPGLDEGAEGVPLRRVEPFVVEAELGEQFAHHVVDGIGLRGQRFEGVLATMASPASVLFDETAFGIVDSCAPCCGALLLCLADFFRLRWGRVFLADRVGMASPAGGSSAIGFPSAGFGD